MTEDRPQPVTEQWAFAGLRLTNTGTLASIWVDDAGNGTDRWFAGRDNKRIIGALYDVEVTRHDTDRLTRHGEPNYTGLRLAHDDERVCRWTVYDNSARVRHQQRRTEANAAKCQALDEALEPLAGLAGTCRTRAERDAFLATVIRRLAARW